MSSDLTLADLERDPGRIATDAVLRSGERVVLRPLEATDAPLLTAYFLSLSDETKRRYGPHPFDRETAERLCAETRISQTLRLVAVVGEGESRQIVGYVIVVWGVGESDTKRYAALGLTLDPAADCTVAPSVADAYQDRGLGSLLMAHGIAVAQCLGRRKMVLMSGVQATNTRAIHYYTKHGFEKVGEFEHPEGFFHHNMWRAL